MKNPGTIIKTAQGLYGIARDKEPRINGKLVIELMEVPAGKRFPCLIPIYKDGKAAKALCDPKKITIVGYIN